MCIFPSWQISGAWCSLFCKSFLWRKGGTTWQHQARTNFTAIACSVRESPCGWSGFSSTRAIPDEGKVIGMFLHTPHPSSYVLGKEGRSPWNQQFLASQGNTSLHTARILLCPGPASTYAESSQCMNELQFSCAIFPQLGWGNWHVSGWSRSFPLIVEMWR